MNTEELEEALMLFAKLTEQQQKIFVELFLPELSQDYGSATGTDAQRENIAERGERGGIS